MLKKPIAAENPLGPGGGFDDEAFATSYPTLYSYFCDLAYEDGTARQTSTLTMFFDEGTLKGSFNDRDNGRSIFMSARSLCELLDCLEAALNDPRTIWRAYKPGYSDKQRGRGKKA